MNARGEAALAHERWAAAAGPWRRWMMAAPLLAPFAWSRADVRSRHNTRARRVAAVLEEKARAAPTLLVLDLPPTLGAAAAALLAERGVAHPVLHLVRWPYPMAVLPTRPLLDVLLQLAEALPANLRAQSVAVVLDGERDLPASGRSALDRRVDNRYEISAEELPDVASLRAAGIARAVTASGDLPERTAFARDVEVRFSRAGLTVERRVLQ